MEQDQDTLTQDLVFDILSSPRRRYVLYYLRKTGEPVALNDLAEQVAAWENETPVDELSDQERKRVYVSLYQTHIPKLDSVGIVEYDQQSGLVELTDRVHRIDDYLTETTSPIPWQQFYLALAAGSGVLLLLSWFEVSVFATIPPVLIGIVITTGFAIAAIAHYLYWRSQRKQVPDELQDRGD
jgi:DNA-binding transcriptional ArsR family regulator